MGDLESIAEEGFLSRVGAVMHTAVVGPVVAFPGAAKYTVQRIASLDRRALILSFGPGLAGLGTVGYTWLSGTGDTPLPDSVDAGLSGYLATTLTTIPAYIAARLGETQVLSLVRETMTYTFQNRLMSAGWLGPEMAAATLVSLVSGMPGQPILSAVQNVSGPLKAPANVVNAEHMASKKPTLLRSYVSGIRTAWSPDVIRTSLSPTDVSVL
jgi:hypothetical protein